MTVIICLSSYAFGSSECEKPSRSVGSFPRSRTDRFMKELETDSCSEKPSDENPMGVLFLEFFDKKTCASLESLTGDIIFSITPYLAKNPAMRADGIYEGDMAGIPYYVTYSQEDRRRWAYNLNNLIMISVLCNPYPDGRPGYYYLWDRYQVTQVAEFSISVMQDGKGEIPLVSSNKPIFFPVSRSHINDREKNWWSLVNITLKHCSEKLTEGWSSTISLVNNRREGINAIIPRPLVDSRQQLLQKAARHNARKGSTTYVTVVEVAEDEAEIAVPRPKLPHVKKRTEEDGAESE